jgi:sporulation protein YlmC with PRC-barrel domain
VDEVRHVDEQVNRLDGALDLALHLLDRQVIDEHGLMVCKVDDVELGVGEDLSILVTGLLAGAAALVPRYGGSHQHGLQRYWKMLGAEQSTRDVPWRIALGDVERLGSAVHLRVPRDGVLVSQDASSPAAGVTRHRLNDLLRMSVRAPDGSNLGHVLDVRAERSDERSGRPIVVTGLVVGRGHPGSLLGYDRRADQGPWLVNRVVRWMHRGSGFLDAANISGLDWEHGVVTLDVGGLEDLTSVRQSDGPSSSNLP